MCYDHLIKRKTEKVTGLFNKDERSFHCEINSERLINSEIKAVTLCCTDVAASAGKMTCANIHVLTGQLGIHTKHKNPWSDT